MPGTEASHTPEAIRRRLGEDPQRSYLRDFIFGAIDGAVTTLAVVSAAAGAGLGAGIIVILGVANLAADGFSMAAANFLGTRAENHQTDRTRREEEREIEVHPEGEREEVRQIYAEKGFDGEILDRIVEVITSDKKRWVDTMLTEEHGLTLTHRSPWRAGWSTFIAFVIIGAIPLLPFIPGVAGLWEVNRPFLYSAILTAIAFFTIGLAKGRVVDKRWWLSGLETLGVGGIAAALAFAAGAVLEGVALNGH